MAIFKVWSTVNPDQPVCYVEAANDGRAIIHAYIHEDGNYFRNDNELGTMEAEEVALSGSLSMRTLRDDRRCSPYCATCGEAILYGSHDEAEPVFCCPECRSRFDPTEPDIGADQETMVCLYQDI